MREPYDVFLREFLQHPAWAEVLERLEKLAVGMKDTLYLENKDNFDVNRGRIMGVYEALSEIRGLIKSGQVRG
jgi:hypothetical protein